MAELDQLNVATERFIERNPALRDNLFQHDPLLRYLKENLKRVFPGGTLIQQGFWYDSAPSAAISKGQELDISEKQVEQAVQLLPKEQYANVTLSLEDIKVFNKGPAAVFDLVKDRVTNAYATLTANTAIQLYLNGQDAGLTKLVNGLTEICNDGTTASWNNNTYPTYGGITRGGQTGTALSSVPFNVNGTIEYNTLEEQYGNVSFGSDEPNLIVTTPLGYSYIKERFQAQQRFNDTQTVAFGFTGMKFNSATILRSRYAPGSVIASGTANSTNKVANNFLSASSGGVITSYPSLAVASSETIWLLNARDPWLNFYVVDDELFGGGFTGFKVAQGNFKVSGQIALFCNLIGSPRYHELICGVTG
jgi:hypothetical protein